MPEHQGPRRHAVVEIIVNGSPITTVLEPYLISVQVIDQLSSSHDQCNIELDDRNAELALPPDKVPLQVAIGWMGEGPRIPDRGRKSNIGGQGEREMTNQEWLQELKWGGPGKQLIFSGQVSSVESGFGRRSGGRRVWIEATSGNVMGPAKAGDIKTWGTGKPDDSAQASTPTSSPSGGGGSVSGTGQGQIPLSKVLSEAFANSGITVKLSPALMNIKRDFWQMNQSPADLAMTIAKEIGGEFKIANGVAAMVAKGENVNVDGVVLDAIEAVWGVNLIGWRIKPYAGRPQWGGALGRVFDVHGGAWNAISQKMTAGGTPFGAALAISAGVFPKMDQIVAAQENTGSDRDSQSRRGTGWVLFNGEPRAHAGGSVLIDKARPGIDGSYLMKEVEHNYTRGVGYTTRAQVAYPKLKESDFTWHRVQPAEPELTPEQIEANKKAEEEAARQKAAEALQLDGRRYSRQLQGFTPEQIEAQKRAAERAEEEAAERADAATAPRAPTLGQLRSRALQITEAQKENARNWYTSRNKPVPPEWQ